MFYKLLSTGCRYHERRNNCGPCGSLGLLENSSKRFGIFSLPCQNVTTVILQIIYYSAGSYFFCSGVQSYCGVQCLAVWRYQLVNRVRSFLSQKKIQPLYISHQNNNLQNYSCDILSKEKIPDLFDEFSNRPSDPQGPQLFLLSWYLQPVLNNL